MHNAVPHSSRWFQVHDQEPFEILSQKLEASQNSATSLAHLSNGDRRPDIADNMIQAEVDACALHIICAAFKEVTLYPWNSNSIRERSR